ncbi:MAG: CARDB domain-containing protein [Nitrospirota bacterium]
MTRWRGVPLVAGLLFAVLGVASRAAAADLPRPVALHGALTPDGASASIQVTVGNPLPNHVSAPGVLEVYLSRDGVIDADDVRLDQRPVTAVAAGGRAEFDLRPAVPPQPPGRYYVIARVLPADPAAAPPRATDALWGVPLALGPDLVIEDLRATNRAEGAQVTGRVRNRGTHTAPAVSVGVLWTLRDDPVTRAQESAALPEVAANSTALFDVLVTPGDLPAGEYGLMAEVDPDQRIAESDEDNNRSRLAAGFRLGPDLVVAELSARQEGGAVVVRDAVSNQGNRSADGCGILFFLSRNGVWDQGDVSLGYRLVPSLQPGTDSRAETHLPIPPRGLSTARYFLIAKVDGANTVAESREGNNLALAPAPLDLRLPP